MKTEIKHFCLSLAAFFALCVAIALTRSSGWLTAWILILTFIALPVLILTWIEMGSALRNAPSSSSALYILGLLFGLPQAFFGLLAFGVGGTIMGWVIYNSLIARQPEYSGGFFTFGVGPSLMFFGIFWIRHAFSREREDSPAQQESCDDDPGDEETED